MPVLRSTFAVMAALIALALPSLAHADNNGNGNGNGNGNSQSDGNNGNGQSNGTGNGNGNNGNGNGNGGSGGSDTTSAITGSSTSAVPSTPSTATTPDVSIGTPTSLPTQSSSETDALKAVQSGSALPLDAILNKAKLADDGRVIDAQLITVQGFLLYAIKLLDPNGTVSIRYFYANSGAPVRVR